MLGVDPVDAGRGAPVVAPRDQRLDSVPRTLEHGFDAAVVEVADQLSTSRARASSRVDAR
jgi:hypothetical protein